MEAGTSLVSSPLQFSLRAHRRNRSNSSSSSSVLLLHELVTPALSSLSPSYSTQKAPPTHFSYSSRPLPCLKEDHAFQKTLDRKLALASSSHEGSDDVDPYQHVNQIHLQLLCRPELWYLLATLQKKGTSFPNSMRSLSMSTETKHSAGLEADHVVALAREALSACREATSIAKDAKLLGVHLSDSCIKGMAGVTEHRTIRSTCLFERQNKRRWKPKPKVEFHETNHHRNPGSRRKLDSRFDHNDPLRLFLQGPETTQLLTATEESELIMNIQELMKLQEVRTRLHAQFFREPTLVEWAAAVGMSFPSLKSQVHTGNSSRQKLIYTNFRLVVHISKQYQGRGLKLHDLLQEGSLGLMKSVEKFKPQVGCRFATYAYWWIRKSVRKALFRHSRTIRLRENAYGLHSKVYEAKKIFVQQGNPNPSLEDIASCAGISVERIEKLLYTARVPLSMQQYAWMGQYTTFQDITADTSIEIPEVGVTKQLMRRHIWNLLSVLNTRERKIIRLRFGITDGKPKSLSEIGADFGLSKERVRQLETRALYKLIQCLSGRGLEAYADMLI